MINPQNMSQILAQAKRMNENLKEKVPGFKNLNNVAFAVFDYSAQKAEGMIAFTGEKWEQTGGIAYQRGRKMVTDAQGIINKKTDQILTKVEDALEVNKQKSKKIVVKNSKDRIIAIFSQLNYIFVLTTQNFKRYSSEVVQHGKQAVFIYCMPIYITLKATVLVTKEMIFEILQNRYQDMKVTYESSKDTVTMIIGGKFNEEQIKAKISEKIQSFKEFRIKVVQKGLQIKIDAKSLRENYDVFAIKFLQVIQNVKQKGTQNIVSAKQRSVNLYNEIINRIKEKQIEIKVNQYEKKKVQ